MFIKSSQRKTIDFLFSNGTKQSFVTELAALSNKFKSIFNVVNNMLNYDVELKIVYEKFLDEYITTNDRYSCFLKYYPDLFKLIDRVYNELNLGKDLSVKVNTEFDLNINYEESVYLFKTSIRTRFFLICYLTDFKMDSISQKEMQKIICKEIIENGILDKFYTIINSIVLNTFPTKSGRKIWDLLSASTGYTADSYAIKLLSSVIYKALPSLKASENPIAFMISIAKNEVDWLLRTKLGVKFVNSEINIVTMTEPTSHIEEHEIYYRTIVKEYFEPILDKYSELSNTLSQYNTYASVSSIGNILLNKIFGINSNHLLIDNLSLVNIFCYDFLKRFDPSKDLLMKVLISIPTNSKYNFGRELPENLKELISNLVVSRELNKTFKHLSPSNIKKILSDSVAKLYNITYVDSDNVELEIDWIKFIEQYINYIYCITSGKYDSYITKIKKEILNNRKEAA